MERNEDDTDIRVAAAATLVDLDLDEMVSILDDESSLLEADGIISAEECIQSSSNTSNASITT